MCVYFAKSNSCLEPGAKHGKTEDHGKTRCVRYRETMESSTNTNYNGLFCVLLLKATEPLLPEAFLFLLLLSIEEEINIVYC